MENEASEIHLDPLFVGLTRPATILGVPYSAFVIEFIGATLVFLGAGNPLYLALVLPVHAVMYLISSNDPGVFGSIFLWLKTIGRCQNTRFWGAASFSPLPTKKFTK